MSEQVKHTPGPWEAEIDPDHDSACDIEITAPCAVIISVLGSDSFACFDEESEGWERFPVEQMANARLVAAAPDMLAACEQALLALETFGQLAATPERIEAQEQAKRLLRPAIAKAKGGAS